MILIIWPMIGAVDGFREIYCVITAFNCLMTMLLSGEYFSHGKNTNRYYAFILFTLGTTLGVFLSSDFFDMYLYFQMSSLASVVGIMHDKSTSAIHAAKTYIIVEMIGSAVILLGMVLLWNLFGTLEIEEIRRGVISMPDKSRAYAAGGCLFFGYGVKAGMIPLQLWMPKVHAVAPAPISMLLSTILTKAGVFGVMLVCNNIFFDQKQWGKFLLLLGTFTMILGAVRALVEVHMKRMLAFSTVSQMGLILLGIGLCCYMGNENQAAVHGTILHMINHSFLKLILYLCAAVIYMKLHTLDLNDIRGFGHGKPILHIVYLSGALGIAGVPLGNGYISKTLLHEALLEAMEYAYQAQESDRMLFVIEKLFLLAGGMTFAYMLKLYVCIFLEKHPENQEQYDSFRRNYMQPTTMLSLLAAGAVPVCFGVFPHVFMDRIAVYGQDILNPELPACTMHYFTWHNMQGAVISVTLGILIYFFIVIIFSD